MGFPLTIGRYPFPEDSVPESDGPTRVGGVSPDAFSISRRLLSFSSSRAVLLCESNLVREKIVLDCNDNL